MSAVPPCTSHLGHRFEARYSTRPSGEHLSVEHATDALAAKLIKAMLVKTYELDICVRCGAVVRKDCK